MARFFGVVGYGENIEDPPDSGVWVDRITEQTYQGNLIRNTAQAERFSRGDPSASFKINEDVGLSNSISIVADQFAIDNWYKIKYVRWMGVAWEVNSVQVQAPRLILDLGRKYNGPGPTPP